jgi:hypothetical protein
MPRTTERLTQLLETVDATGANNTTASRASVPGRALQAAQRLRDLRQ